jgi:endo-1,4-beta-xylanase
MASDRDPRHAATVALGAAVMWGHATGDAGYREAFLREFQSLTPENEMKMEGLQPHRGEFDFEEADALVGFAHANGRPVHGHTLVWHRQNPAWLSAGAQTPTEVTDVLREHVGAVVAHYRGRVREWDVVNEPLTTQGRWRRNIWSRAIGEDYVAQALYAARAADPQAHLFINEIGADVANPKSDALHALARRLVAAQVPLDGIGLQLHTALGRAPGRGPLEANIRRFAELGLRVQITEMDVAAGGPPERRAERLARQAQVYRDAAAACRAVPGCERLTVWGVCDRYAWIGAAEEPLLLDAGCAPKPALGAVRDAIAGG